MKPRIAVFGALLITSTLACSLLGAPATPAASLPTVVAATLQALTLPAPPPTQGPSTEAAPTQAAGVPVSFSGMEFVIPQGLASGASCEMVPAVDAQSGAPWEVAPAYIRCTLQAYPLAGKFFQPQIMIYPAQEYAAASGGAAMSIQQLQAILASPAAPVGNDALPHLPWANAEQMIGAQIKIIPFQAGSGVRVLAEYAQYDAPINNHELFYHFEGLSSNGKSYIVTTLPINTASLAADSNPASPVPADGVPFPGINVSDPTVWTNYYQAVTIKLNATTPDQFQPSLTALDSLIQSFQVSP